MLAVPERIGELVPLAERCFADIAALTADLRGVTREAYGEGEQKAYDYLAGLAAREGLRVSADVAGNLRVSLAGRRAETIAIGSHLDSVPRGGNFDGLAGVVAGLLCLVQLRRSGVTPPRGIEVLGIRGEESAWFGTPLIGSKALFGKLQRADLERPHRKTGRPLRAHFADIGVDAERLAESRPVLPSCVAFFELHIEQGPVLEENNIPVGLVTGICGSLRHAHATCRGEAGHSGAVPRALRRDAAMGFAEFLTRVDAAWAAAIGTEPSLTFTTGVIATDPDHHAASRIPDSIAFSVDIRAASVAAMESFHRIMAREAEQVAARRGVSFDFGTISLTEPTGVCAAFLPAMEACAASLGIKTLRLPSGAGHDAGLFALHGIPTGMIFVRNQNGSHNPDEGMRLDDFMQATAVLSAMVAREP